MCHHGGEAPLDAHHERSGPSSVPSHPTQDVGSNTGTLTAGAIFMQNAVVGVVPIGLIITSLDVKGAFLNTPHRVLQAVWEHIGILFQEFLQVYLATRLYAVQTDVDTTPWTHARSGVPQGGAEGPFLFLLVILPLAFYIRHTYPDVALYPLRTTPLAFADDMAVVAATACQTLPDSQDNLRANMILNDVPSYPKNNQLLVHNVTSATMVHNAPPPPLRPGDVPMTPTDNATFLGIQQAGTPVGVTVPPNLERGLTRNLAMGRIAALSTQALAYFLHAVLNAAIRFQALPPTHPEHMLQRAVTTVRRAWAIHGHQPTSLRAEVSAASVSYYGDGTHHLVHSAYTAHTAIQLHGLMHNQAPEIREVLTLTLREARHRRNTSPQYILHQQGLPTTVGTRIWNHL